MLTRIANFFEIIFSLFGLLLSRRTSRRFVSSINKLRRIYAGRLQSREHEKVTFSIFLI